MVKEDYVNEEIMKLLLEKGYPLDKVVVQDFRTIWYTKDYNDPQWQDCDAYYIPTQSQVLKWLREVHKIIITIDFDEYELESQGKKVGYGYNLQLESNPTEYEKISNLAYDTYEKAVEEGISYSLINLI